MADQPQPRFGQVNPAELADLVAHEVNNQLNGLILHLALLERSIPGEARAAAQPELRQIRQTIHRAGCMLHRWQQTAGKPAVSLETVDLHQFLRELPLPQTLTNAAGEPVKVQFQPAPELPRVVASREDTRELVSLLLHHAAQTSPAHGTITVQTVHEHGYVLLSVEDQGPEVAPDLLERAFEPFTAVRASVLANGEAELWLAASKILARRQQGTIAAERGAAGGLKITVRFSTANDK